MGADESLLQPSLSVPFSLIRCKRLCSTPASGATRPRISHSAGGASATASRQRDNHHDRVVRNRDPSIAGPDPRVELIRPETLT